MAMTPAEALLALADIAQSAGPNHPLLRPMRFDEALATLSAHLAKPPPVAPPSELESAEALAHTLAGIAQDPDASDCAGTVQTMAPLIEADRAAAYAAGAASVDEKEAERRGYERERGAIQLALDALRYTQAALDTLRSKLAKGGEDE